MILPPYIDPEAWGGFREMRLQKGQRTPFTERAQQMILKTLGQLKDAGHDPNASLDQSTLNGWSNVFEPKEHTISTKTPSNSIKTARADSKTAQYLEEQGQHLADIRADQAIKKASKVAA